MMYRSSFVRTALRRGLSHQQTRTMGRRQTQRLVSSHGSAPIAVRAIDFLGGVSGAELSIPRGWELDEEEDDGG